MAVRFVIGEEGGYVSDPHDNGGETKFGISKRAYPMLNIKALTEDEAKALYKRDYWDKINGDKLPYPFDVLVFDSAVNQGVSGAVKPLQKVLSVEQDGVIGKDTLFALKGRQARETAALYLVERALKYIKHEDFDKYGRGWLKRLFKVALACSGV